MIRFKFRLTSLLLVPFLFGITFVCIGRTFSLFPLLLLSYGAVFAVCEHSGLNLTALVRRGGYLGLISGACLLPVALYGTVVQWFEKFSGGQVLVDVAAALFVGAWLGLVFGALGALIGGALRYVVGSLRPHAVQQAANAAAQQAGAERSRVRTLFYLLLTAFAVVPACMIVWHVSNSIREERLFNRRLALAGVSTSFDSRIANTGIVWLDAFEKHWGLRYFTMAIAPRVLHIELRDDLSESDWRNLAGCRRFDHVSISTRPHHQVDLAQLVEHARRIPAARIRLDLKYAGICDADLGRFERMPALSSVDLSGNAITDAGLMELSALPQLDSIWLFGTEVSIEGIWAFREAAKNEISVRHE